MDYSTEIDMGVIEPLLEQYGLTPEILALFGGAIVMIVFVILILAIVMYVLGAIGLSSLAKTKGYANTWVAWIPVANNYLLGKTAFDNANFGWAYLAATIASWFLLIPGKTTIMAILGFVVFFFLFKRFSKQYVVMTVLNVITFGFLSSFFMFGIRKNEEITVGVKEEVKEETKEPEE